MDFWGMGVRSRLIRLLASLKACSFPMRGALAYRLIRDFFVFTEKRLIIVEIQGIRARRSTTLPFPIDL